MSEKVQPTQDEIYGYLKTFLMKIGYIAKGDPESPFTTADLNAYRSYMEQHAAGARHPIEVPTTVDAIHPSIRNHECWDNEDGEQAPVGGGAQAPQGDDGEGDGENEPEGEPEGTEPSEPAAEDDGAGSDSDDAEGEEGEEGADEEDPKE